LPVADDGGGGDDQIVGEEGILKALPVVDILTPFQFLKFF